MKQRGVSQLQAYRRAVNLADDVHRCVADWGSFDKWTVGVQMVRAADSVGANLAEAYGRWGYADRRRVLFIARGSACELEHWLALASTRHLPLPKEAQRSAEEIGRMLNGLARAWRP